MTARTEKVLHDLGISSELPGRRNIDRPSLEVFDVADVAKEVDGAGTPEWLIEGKWPASDYGVSGAEDKAGKTWNGLDLAVSIASGMPYLGRFKCKEGAVVLWLGEGGKRNMIRRLRAICSSKGIELEDLVPHLRLCFRVPRLTDKDALQEVADELSDHPAVFSGLDPFYLAAAGSKGSDLYNMGEALYGIQQVHQDAGAAFCITTHWTKGGEGGGAKRFVGVGPSAWGRVLGSAEVESRRSEDGGLTEVLLRWEYTGGEIPDQSFRVLRRVWADDQLDLASPLHYEVEVTEELDGIGLGASKGMPPRQSRTLHALKGSSQTHAMGVRIIGNGIAKDGHGPPLRPRTIQTALPELKVQGLVDGGAENEGLPGYWWITEKGDAWEG